MPGMLKTFCKLSLRVESLLAISFIDSLLNGPDVGMFANMSRDTGHY